MKFKINLKKPNISIEEKAKLLYPVGTVFIPTQIEKINRDYKIDFAKKIINTSFVYHLDIWVLCNDIIDIFENKHDYISFVWYKGRWARKVTAEEMLNKKLNDV